MKPVRLLCYYMFLLAFLDLTVHTTFKGIPIILHLLTNLFSQFMSAIVCFHDQNNSTSSPGLLG